MSQYTVKGAFEKWADALPSEPYQLLTGEAEIYQLARAAYTAGHDRGAVHESYRYANEIEDMEEVLY